jgi:cyclopropane fatty-acyl-phospholipid synthase-like methyltransferase
MTKPYSQACENNKAPILAVLREVFAGCRRILEIGSGTGQHAVFFAGQLPDLLWQTADLAANHEGINSWVAEAGLSNVLPPIALNVSDRCWPAAYDGIFTANSLHIMAWGLVEDFFKGVGRTLPVGGVLCIYGPFNYQGNYTSDSNAQFDRWLKQRDPLSAIRDVEAVLNLAREQGLSCIADHPMPANNRLLVWVRERA